MKKIFTASLLLLTITSAAQQKKGYAFLGPAIYMNTKASSDVIYGGTFGFSNFSKQAALGLTVDFLTQKNGGVYLPMYGDLHFFLSKKHEGAFILAQPGYIIRSKTILSAQDFQITESGGFYFGAGLGFLSMLNKTGLTAQLKYVFFNTHLKAKVGNETNTVNNQTKAIALSVAIAF